MEITLASNPVSSPKGRKRGRPRAGDGSIPDDDAMLDVAFSLFARVGFDGASMRLMGEHLGVTSTVLYQRFESKDELWRRAVTRNFARASAPVLAAFDDTAAPPRDILARIVRRYCDATMADPRPAMLINAESMFPSWRLAFLVENMIAPFQRRLEPLLRSVAGSSAISPLAFMTLLIEGAGSYFAARPLMRLLRDTDGGEDEPDPVEMREKFVRLLLAAAQG